MIDDDLGIEVKWITWELFVSDSSIFYRVLYESLAFHQSNMLSLVFKFHKDMRWSLIAIVVIVCRKRNRETDVM